MPITINEMKMPNNCKECEFHQSGYPDWCDLSCRSRDVFNPSIRPDWCPLEDAVPVVRCKECKHKPTGTGVNHDIEFPDDVCPCKCEDYWYSWMPQDDFFCAWGERKKDA